MVDNKEHYNFDLGVKELNIKEKKYLLLRKDVAIFHNKTKFIFIGGETDRWFLHLSVASDKFWNICIQALVVADVVKHEQETFNRIFELS